MDASTRRRWSWIAALAAAALFAAACGQPAAAPAGDAEGPPPATFKCGSQGYAEVEIMCEMAKAIIEHETPHSVQHVMRLGSALAAHQAVVRGDLDMQINFTGTHFLGTYEMALTDEWRDPDQVWQFVHDKLLEDFNVWAFRPFGYNNVYALAVPKALADRHGLRSVSDLAALAPGMVLGTDTTFQEYPGQGYKEWAETYYRFKDSVAMEIPLLYRAIIGGEVDAIMAYSTDGRIPAQNLVVLEDDKGFNPPYYGIIVVRQGVLDRYPEVKAALERLEGQIDTATMAALNARVDVDDVDPAVVAREFLTERGLID